MHAAAAAYIKYMDKIFAFFEKLSREFLGYEVKQTLLLHTNELNADHFDELVGVMRRRGYTFVGLEAALQDKAYSLPDATDFPWAPARAARAGTRVMPDVERAGGPA